MHIVFYQLQLPLLFLKEEMKFAKNWIGGANFKNICMGNQKGEGRGNVKVIASCDFFIFIFSLLAMMVINFAFRKSSLEEFFQKNIWTLVLLFIGHIIRTC